MTAPSPPHVVYVAGRLNFQIAKQSTYLRRVGWRTTLLSLVPVPDSLREAVRGSFDAFSDEPATVAEIAARIAAEPPAVVHVLCWMFQYDIARRLLEALPGIPIVCEFQDITSGVMAPLDLYSVWGGDRVDRDLDDERFIFRNAAGVIHRLSDAVIGEIAARHHGRALLLQFFPYPCPDYAQPPVVRPPRPGAGPRLVYAGGLPPADANHPPEYFPLAQMPMTIRALLDQGCSVTILHDPMRPPPEHDPGFEPYRALAEQYDSFSFRYGVPHDALGAAMAEFDYGLILSHLHPEVLRRRAAMCRGDVGTKLFPYFEAGIPAIVNAEFSYMAGIVTDRSLGFGLSTADIPRLREIADRAPYAAYQEGVRRYVAQSGMDKEIARMVAFYEQAIWKAKH